MVTKLTNGESPAGNRRLANKSPMKTRLMLLSIISLICFGCINRDKDDNSTKHNGLSFQDSTLHNDTVTQKLAIEQPIAQSEKSSYIPSKHQADSLILKIRTYFGQINKITKWTKVQREFLEGTHEGGEAKFFILNNELKKITTDQMGTTFRVVTEYYIHNSELVFVYEKFEKYHMPLDRSNSKFFESRKYFNEKKIFKRINSETKDNPLDEISVVEDQEQTLEELKNLKKLLQTSL